MGVIVGAPEDPHTLAVLQAATQRGHEPLVFDAKSLSESDLYVDANETALGDRELLRRIGGGRGWLRRLAPENWIRQTLVDGHDAVVRSAWIALLVATCEASDTEWLSGLSTLHASEDKLRQLRVAAQLGIRVPATALVTRPERIPTALGDQVVVKPFGIGHFHDDDGRARIVHATEMSRTDPALDLLAGAPFFVQERLRSRTHLRVVTVLDEVWVCSLAADGLPLDWRADEGAHSSFTPAADPTVGAQAIRLAGKLGIGYSSQDWIVDQKGNHVFLDLNPAGQWLFLPGEVSAAVTDAIATWVVS